MADEASKAESSIAQPEGCTTSHTSMLLWTPAHPQQMKAFTLTSLICGNIVDTGPNAVSSHPLWVIPGTEHSSRQKCQIRNVTFPLHLCPGDYYTPYSRVNLCTQEVTHCCAAKPCFWPSL